MEINELIDILSSLDPKLPHCSNIRTKLSNEVKGKTTNAVLTKEIAKLYLKYHTSINELSSTDDTRTWIYKSLEFFELYYSKIRSAKYRIFSHQSDLLSSLLPEYLYLLYTKFILKKYPEFIIETQKDLIIDLSFLPHSSSMVVFKSKRVDVAILKPCPFIINKIELEEFNIAVIAAEVKTNLDKNMISGVEYSVQRLKRTFPLCKYYLIAEFVDFAFEKQNYAASAIDEILITRKQKRIEVRNDVNKVKPISADIIFTHLTEVLDFLEKNVIESISLNQRLKKGKLIK